MAVSAEWRDSFVQTEQTGPWNKPRTVSGEEGLRQVCGSPSTPEVLVFWNGSFQYSRMVEGAELMGKVATGLRRNPVAPPEVLPSIAGRLGPVDGLLASPLRNERGSDRQRLGSRGQAGYS